MSRNSKSKAGRVHNSKRAPATTKSKQLDRGWLGPPPSTVRKLSEFSSGSPFLSLSRRKREYCPLQRQTFEVGLSPEHRLPEVAPAELATLQCNLLVVNPQPRGVWAFRYVNDRVLKPAQARREKVNILRLFAWLSQEKILRRPQQMMAVIADLLPRWNLYPADQGPELFSSITWWSHDRLWEFIGVPFGVVDIAIDEVGKGLRGELVRSLSHSSS